MQDLAVRRNRHVMGDHLRELARLHDTLHHHRGLPSDVADGRVHRTLARISHSSRDVLMLRFFGDLSLEQIARTLGIGLSAAKMRLYRTQEQFARSYGEEVTPDVGGALGKALLDLGLGDSHSSCYRRSS